MRSSRALLLLRRCIDLYGTSSARCWGLLFWCWGLRRCFRSGWLRLGWLPGWDRYWWGRWSGGSGFRWVGLPGMRSIPLGTLGPGSRILCCRLRGKVSRVGGMRGCLSWGHWLGRRWLLERLRVWGWAGVPPSGGSPGGVPPGKNFLFKHNTFLMLLKNLFLYGVA